MPCVMNEALYGHTGATGYAIRDNGQQSDMSEVCMQCKAMLTLALCEVFAEGGRVTLNVPEPESTVAPFGTRRNALATPHDLIWRAAAAACMPASSPRDDSAALKSCEDTLGI